MMVKGLDYFISKLDPSVELRFNTPTELCLILKS